jgi:hypothetical protein
MEEFYLVIGGEDNDKNISLKQEVIEEKEYKKNNNIMKFMCFEDSELFLRKKAF